MSYCRWSSDNFKCDIYAYESCHGGFDIWIASNRIVGEPPKGGYGLILEDNSKENIEKFVEQERARSKWMDSCKREPIELPFVGDHFNEPDLESFYNRMIKLRGIGYNFPDYVLETIKEEMNESET